ncbi:MAG: beta-galactosidase, partial [Armatimonadota bacterium]
VPARTVPDFLRRLRVPLTTPGTYRLQGTSCDAKTGEYFTTDWVKLIVLKGQPKSPPPSPTTALLTINPAHPFGRLEPTDPRRVSFVVSAAPALFPLELRYSVIPYDEFIPAWKPVRELALDQKLTVKQPGVVTVPYTPRRTVELVVAELWQGNKRLDHQERPIGIRNELAKAPPLTQAAAIPTLDDLAGPGKNWLNAQLHANPGEDQAANLARNLSEVKKLTPNLGLYLSVNRVEPIPGVYDWDYLTPILDLAQSQGCRIIPYLNLKWPADWAHLEFAVDSSGCAHRGGLMWGYMIGKYLYCSGRAAPEIIRGFNQQLARRYLNHPGLGGYYFENEHMDSYNGPLNSYHEAFRAGFSDFLKARYGTLADLSAAYGRPYTAWTQVRLPDANRPETVPAPAALADLRLFQLHSAERFLLRDEFDAVRQEDPRRPIIVYNIGNESDSFLRHVADNGGMMANGGIHSNFNMDFEYERANAVPGLRYRMEPHDMYNYDPVPHGFDEMIFGMLSMGGRGLQLHEFLPGWTTWQYDQAVAPGQKTGLDKLIAARPMLAELRDAEKLHDPLGLMTLRSPQHFLGGPFEWTTWPLHCALYALQHYSPKSVAPEGRLAYLDGSKLIFIGGSVIAADEIAQGRR